MGNGTPGTTVQRAAGIQEMAVMALDGAVDGAVVAGASAMIVIAGAMMVNETPGTTVQRAAGVQEIAMRALDGAVDRAVVAGATTMRAEPWTSRDCRRNSGDSQGSSCNGYSGSQ